MLAGERVITLDWRIQTALVCNSDTDVLLRIFHNLIGNALRYGNDKVRVSAGLSGTKDRIIVRITNFTAPENPAQSGTGMGLRLVRSLTNVLGQTRFTARKTPLGFSVRLGFPLEERLVD